MTQGDRTTDNPDVRIDRTTRQLLDAAEALNIEISPAGQVREIDAGVLLGLAPGVLKQRRIVGTGPCFYRRPWRGARLTYRLTDLAGWLEQGRADDSEWASTSSSGIDCADHLVENRVVPRRRRS